MGCGHAWNWYTALGSCKDYVVYFTGWWKEDLLPLMLIITVDLRMAKESKQDTLQNDAMMCRSPLSNWWLVFIPLPSLSPPLIPSFAFVQSHVRVMQWRVFNHKCMIHKFIQIDNPIKKLYSFKRLPSFANTQYSWWH